MRFGEVVVGKAGGAMLAHSVKTKKGQLKKGRRLTKGDCKLLEECGVRRVVVARLSEGDIGENEAAKKIASAVSGGGIFGKRAFTGRANLFARSAGVISVNRELVDRMNRVNPDITIATLNDDSFVEEGQMVATTKIISLAVPLKSVGEVVRLANNMQVVELYKTKPKRVGLIATKLPHTKASVIQKTKNNVRERLAASGSRLVKNKQVGHSAEEVANAVKGMRGACDIIIVFGASAIADKNDVIPSGVRKVGAKVIHLGMPVDPGNLLMLATLGKKWVIGAPGCARSSALNGFDYVLNRAVCGAPLNSNYITGLGVGGLLTEIRERGKLREEQ